MDYVNNWQRPITLGAAETSVALDLPDGTYRLSISNADRTQFEVVGAVVASGSATLTRALEGTTAQEWAAGSLIYCSVTAGVLAGFGGGGANVYRGDGSPVGVVTAPAGSNYVDNLNADEIWYAADDDYWVRLVRYSIIALDIIGVYCDGSQALSSEGVLSAGAEVVFSSTVIDVFTNVTLTTAGSTRKFTASGGPHYYKLSGAGDGHFLFMANPLTVSTPPAP